METKNCLHTLAEIVEKFTVPKSEVISDGTLLLEIVGHSLSE